MIEIKKINNLDCEIVAPPSKAYTLRAIFIAAMAKGNSIINNPLMAEDQKYTINAMKDMGVDIKLRNNKIIIKGVNGKFKNSKNNLFIGNSGVSARVLIVLCSLIDQDTIINGTERMRIGRPIQDLINAIKNLGINAKSINNNGCLPVSVKGNSFQGGLTTLKGNKSSQYFTALLLCAPYAKRDVTIKTIGDLCSKPYIDITIDIMKRFGIKVENKDYQEFKIKSNHSYIGKEYYIEGDYSNAAYFFAAAAITKGKIRVKNLNFNSIQGDKRFLDFIEMMGCEINKEDGYIEVIGKPLKGIKVDMQDYPDIVQPLAIVAAFARDESEFYNISNLKYKECDRLKATVTELKRIGINANFTENSIIVEGGKPHGAEIETYKDHRMVMSFSIIGLAVEGIKIKNPENINKSFPEFFDVLNNIYKK